MEGQGRLQCAKSAWLKDNEMTEFWPDLPFPKVYANFGGPAGGCSLRACCPLMAGMWLVETVLLTVKANLFFSRGLEADPVTNRKPGKIFTSSLIGLDPGNRFRYPLVSLFFMMCLCLRIAGLVQEICLISNLRRPRSVAERKIRMVEKS